MKKSLNQVVWYRSILMKQATMLLLTLCPSILLFFGLYQIFQIESIEKLTEATLSRDTAIFSELESSISDIEFRQYDLFNESDFHMISALWNQFSEEEQIARIQNVQNRLEWFYNSEDWIEEIKIYFLKPGLTISPNIYRKTTSEEQDKILGYLNKKNIMKVEDGVVKVYTRSLAEGSRPEQVKYVAEITISKFKVNQMIKKLASDGNTSSILLVNQESLQSDFSKSDYLFQQLQEEYKNLRASDEKQRTVILTKNREKYFCVLAKSQFYDIALITVRPYGKVFVKSRQVARLVVLLCFLNLIAIFLFLIYIYLYMKRPIDLLGNAFLRLQNNEEPDIKNYPAHDEFSVLYRGFNEMNIKLQKYIDQTYLQKIELQRSELKQLQSQINPHFLYNSFFMLKSRIRCKEYEGAIQLSELLGDYFQFLNRDQEDYITLKKEIEHAYVYAQIQESRFGNRFSLEWEEIPAKYEDVSIPRLVLQPLVENSIKYGFEHTEEDGILRFYFREKVEEGKLEICITESERHLKSEKLEAMNELVNLPRKNIEVTGTININRRLKLFYGETYGLSFESNKQGDFISVVSIDPERKKENGAAKDDYCR